MVKGMGGAMDLVADVKKVIVMMEHTTKKGDAKLIPKCTLPLTGERCVDLIITDLCVLVMNPDRARFEVTELAPGTTVEEVQSKTAGESTTAQSLKTVEV